MRSRSLELVRALDTRQPFSSDGSANTKSSGCCLLPVALALQDLLHELSALLCKFLSSIIIL